MFAAKVVSNEAIRGDFRRLSLEFSGAGAEAFGSVRPGQFAQLELADVGLPAMEQIPEELRDVSRRKILLRRPFSFYDVNVKDNKAVVRILYRVVGPATVRMMAIKHEDFLNVLGPLGNGFKIAGDKHKAVLVAGGMGVPPLIHLAKILTAEANDIEVVALAGAKSADALPFGRPLDEISQNLGYSIGEFAKFGIVSQVSTDDGSAGYKGLVTDCLAEWLDGVKERPDEVVVYGCGPEQMLAKTVELAKKYNVDCQVSMERRMACGFGVCQSCAVKCRDNNGGEDYYKMCCQDGPVFDGREVVFDDGERG